MGDADRPRVAARDPPVAGAAAIDGPQDVAELLEDVDRRLAPHLEDALTQLPDGQPLRDGVTRQIRSGGKRVRAALCVLACRLFDGDEAGSLPFAAAIEHVQNLTLVHDDIADDDPQRRSQDAMWKRYGIGHAINIGDSFVPLAALAVLRGPYADGVKLQLLELMAECGLRLVAGQNLDLILRGDDSVTAQRYFDCTTRKTGALLAMAAVGGGVIGGAAEPDLRRLDEFATRAGAAFQIRDDLLDMYGNKGRDPGCDVREGKRTLMVVYAAERASAGEREQLFTILNKPRAATSPDDVRWVWELFKGVGADTQAARTAETLIDESCRHVLALPDTPSKYQLLRVARYLGVRDR